MENTFYNEFKKWTKSKKVWSSREIPQDLENKYLKHQEEIKSFDNCKVKIEYTSTNDWLSKKGTLIGKIRVENDQPRFFEGKKRSKYKILDAGIFEGFFATIIPLEITKV